MTHPQTEERRPRGKGTAPLKLNNDTPSLPDPSRVLEGVYVVVVAHPVPGELRTRRRVYLNLNAAQRAADRAAERGHRAAVVLCALTPVHELNGGWCA